MLSRLRKFERLSLLAVAYFTATLLSAMLMHDSGGLPVIWPAPAILLAYLAVSGSRVWPLMAGVCGVAGIAALLVAGWSVFLAISIIAISLAEEMIAFWILRRLRRGQVDWLDNLGGLFTLIAVAGILTPAAFALPAMWLTGVPEGATTLATYASWVAADGLGAVFFTPVFLLAIKGVIRRDYVKLNPQQRTFLHACLVLMIIITFLVFSQSTYPLLFLPVLPMLAATFAGSRGGALISAVMLMTISFLATFFHSGPISSQVQDAHWQWHFLQFYLAVVFLTILPSAIELEGRRLTNFKLLRSEQRAHDLAQRDPLTGLPNRRAFMDTLESWIAEARDRRQTLMVAMIDLNDFKIINDQYGHWTGDQALRRMAERMHAAIDGNGLVARMGGDEFALLYLHENTRSRATLPLHRLLATLEDPVRINGQNYEISAACGVVEVRPDNNLLPSRILARADTAMYHAKRSGTVIPLLFDSQMEQDEQRKVWILRQLQTPDGRRDITLVFQPVFDLATMDVVSLEALARWDSRIYGSLTPGEFIPLAEGSGMIIPLTLELFEMAVREALSWHKTINLSFNISAVHICEHATAQDFIAIMERNGFDPARLKLEITETAVLGSSDIATENCIRLKNRGVRILLDDFGAGYASISYLSSMPFDEIKLDSSIIHGARQPQGRSIARGLLALCTELGKPCTAEHLETPADIRIFRDMGCRFGQGFSLRKPLTAEEAVWLFERSPKTKKLA